MKRAGAISGSILGLVLIASGASAGTFYEARSELQRSDRREPERFTIRGWVEGDSAKVEMEGHTDLGGSSYLLATEGGEVVYLVDPDEERYFSYVMAGGLAGLSQASGGMMDLQLSEISSEVVGTAPGGTILGHSTRRVDWRASYQLEMKMGFGMDRSMRFEVEGQSWLAGDLDADDFSMWLWNGDLKRILAGIHGDQRGFPLRMRSRSRMIAPDGQEQISTSDLEVTQVRSEPIPESAFVIPAHYQEISIPGFGAAGEGSAGAPQGQPQGPMKALKGLFGKRKKGGG